MQQGLQIKSVTTTCVSNCIQWTLRIWV